MSLLENVTLQMNLDDKDFTREFNDVTKTVNKQMNALTLGASAFEAKWADITHNLRSFKRVASGLAISAAIYGVVDAITSASSAILTFRNNLEASKISMEYFAESSAQAQEYIRELEDFAAYTPFSTESAISMAQYLQAMSVPINSSKSVLKVISDTAAATGATEENMQRIVTALGQVLTKGKLAAEEVRQLANANIPIYDILKEQLNLTGQEIKNLGNLNINASKAVVAILDGLKERYEGASAKIAETLGGMTETIKDDALIISESFFHGTLDRLEGKIRSIRDTLDSWREVSMRAGTGGMIETILGDITSTEEERAELEGLVISAIAAFKNLGETIHTFATENGTVLKSFAKTAYAAIMSLTVAADYLLKGINMLETAGNKVLSVFNKFTGASLELSDVVAGLLIFNTVGKTIQFAGNTVLWTTKQFVNFGTTLTSVIPVINNSNAVVKGMTASVLTLGAALASAYLGLKAMKTITGVTDDSTLVTEEYRQRMEEQNALLSQWEDSLNEDYSSIADNWAAKMSGALDDTEKKSKKTAKKAAKTWLMSFDEVFQIREDPDDLSKTLEAFNDINWADFFELPEFRFPEMPDLTNELDDNVTATQINTEQLKTLNTMLPLLFITGSSVLAHIANWRAYRKANPIDPNGPNDNLTARELKEKLDEKFRKIDEQNKLFEKLFKEANSKRDEITRLSKQEAEAVDDLVETVKKKQAFDMKAKNNPAIKSSAEYLEIPHRLSEIQGELAAIKENRALATQELQREMRRISVLEEEQVKVLRDKESLQLKTGDARVTPDSIEAAKRFQLEQKIYDEIVEIADNSAAARASRATLSVELGKQIEAGTSDITDIIAKNGAAIRNNSLTIANNTNALYKKFGPGKGLLLEQKQLDHLTDTVKTVIRDYTTNIQNIIDTAVTTQVSELGQVLPDKQTMNALKGSVNKLYDISDSKLLAIDSKERTELLHKVDELIDLSEKANELQTKQLALKQTEASIANQSSATSPDMARLEKEKGALLDDIRLNTAEVAHKQTLLSKYYSDLPKIKDKVDTANKLLSQMQKNSTVHAEAFNAASFADEVAYYLGPTNTINADSTAYKKLLEIGEKLLANAEKIADGTPGKELITTLVKQSQASLGVSNGLDPVSSTGLENAIVHFNEDLRGAISDAVEKDRQLLIPIKEALDADKAVVPMDMQKNIANIDGKLSSIDTKLSGMKDVYKSSYDTTMRTAYSVDELLTLVKEGENTSYKTLFRGMQDVITDAYANDKGIIRAVEDYLAKYTENGRKTIPGSPDKPNTARGILERILNSDVGGDIAEVDAARERVRLMLAQEKVRKLKNTQPAADFRQEFFDRFDKDVLDESRKAAGAVNAKYKQDAVESRLILTYTLDKDTQDIFSDIANYIEKNAGKGATDTDKLDILKSLFDSEYSTPPTDAPKIPRGLTARLDKLESYKDFEKLYKLSVDMTTDFNKVESNYYDFAQKYQDEIDKLTNRLALQGNTGTVESDMFGGTFTKESLDTFKKDFNAATQYGYKTLKDQFTGTTHADTKASPWDIFRNYVDMHRSVNPDAAADLGFTRLGAFKRDAGLRDSALLYQVLKDMTDEIPEEAAAARNLSALLEVVKYGNADRSFTSYGMSAANLLDYVLTGTDKELVQSSESILQQAFGEAFSKKLALALSDVLPGYAAGVKGVSNGLGAGMFAANINGLAEIEGKLYGVLTHTNVLTESAAKNLAILNGLGDKIITLSTGKEATVVTADEIIAAFNKTQPELVNQIKASLASNPERGIILTFTNAADDIWNKKWTDTYNSLLAERKQKYFSPEEFRDTAKDRLGPMLDDFRYSDNFKAATRVIVIEPAGDAAEGFAKEFSNATESLVDALKLRNILNSKGIAVPDTETFAHLIANTTRRYSKKEFKEILDPIGKKLVDAIKTAATAGGYDPEAPVNDASIMREYLEKKLEKALGTGNIAELKGELNTLSEQLRNFGVAGKAGSFGGKTYSFTIGGQRPALEGDVRDILSGYFDEMSKLIDDTSYQHLTEFNDYVNKLSTGLSDLAGDTEAVRKALSESSSELSNTFYRLKNTTEKLELSFGYAKGAVSSLWDDLLNTGDTSLLKTATPFSFPSLDEYAGELTYKLLVELGIDESSIDTITKTLQTEFGFTAEEAERLIAHEQAYINALKTVENYELSSQTIPLDNTYRFTRGNATDDASRLATDAADDAADKAAKDASKAAKDALEDTTGKAAKDAAEDAAGTAAKDAAEDAAGKAAKDTIKTVTDDMLDKAPRTMEEAFKNALDKLGMGVTGEEAEKIGQETAELIAEKISDGLADGKSLNDIYEELGKAAGNANFSNISDEAFDGFVKSYTSALDELVNNARSIDKFASLDSFLKNGASPEYAKAFKEIVDNSEPRFIEELEEIISTRFSTDKPMTGEEIQELIASRLTRDAVGNGGVRTKTPLYDALINDDLEELLFKNFAATNNVDAANGYVKFAERINEYINELAKKSGTSTDDILNAFKNGTAIKLDEGVELSAKQLDALARSAFNDLATEKVPVDDIIKAFINEEDIKIGEKLVKYTDLESILNAEFRQYARGFSADEIYEAFMRGDGIGGPGRGLGALSPGQTEKELEKVAKEVFGDSYDDFLKAVKAGWYTDAGASTLKDSILLDLKEGLGRMLTGEGAAGKAVKYTLTPNAVGISGLDVAFALKQALDVGSKGFDEYGVYQKLLSGASGYDLTLLSRDGINGTKLNDSGNLYSGWDLAEVGAQNLVVTGALTTIIADAVTSAITGAIAGGSVGAVPGAIIGLVSSAVAALATNGLMYATGSYNAANVASEEWSKMVNDHSWAYDQAMQQGATDEQARKAQWDAERYIYENILPDMNFWSWVDKRKVEDIQKRSALDWSATNTGGTKQDTMRVDYAIKKLLGYSTAGYRKNGNHLYGTGYTSSGHDYEIDLEFPDEEKILSQLYSLYASGEIENLKHGKSTTDLGKLWKERIRDMDPMQLARLDDYFNSYTRAMEYIRLVGEDTATEVIQSWGADASTMSELIQAVISVHDYISSYQSSLMNWKAYELLSSDVQTIDIAALTNEAITGYARRMFEGVDFTHIDTSVLDELGTATGVYISAVSEAMYEMSIDVEKLRDNVTGFTMTFPKTIEVGGEEIVVEQLRANADAMKVLNGIGVNINADGTVTVATQAVNAGKSGHERSVDYDLGDISDFEKMSLKEAGIILSKGAGYNGDEKVNITLDETALSQAIKGVTYNLNGIDLTSVSAATIEALKGIGINLAQNQETGLTSATITDTGYLTGAQTMHQLLASLDPEVLARMSTNLQQAFKDLDVLTNYGKKHGESMFASAAGVEIDTGLLGDDYSEALKAAFENAGITMQSALDEEGNEHLYVAINKLGEQWRKAITEWSSDEVSGDVRKFLEAIGAEVYQEGGVVLVNTNDVLSKIQESGQNYLTEILIDNNELWSALPDDLKKQLQNAGLATEDGFITLTGEVLTGWAHWGDENTASIRKAFSAMDAETKKLFTDQAGTTIVGYDSLSAVQTECLKKLGIDSRDEYNNNADLLLRLSNNSLGLIQDGVVKGWDDLNVVQIARLSKLGIDSKEEYDRASDALISLAISDIGLMRDNSLLSWDDLDEKQIEKLAELGINSKEQYEDNHDKLLEAADLKFGLLKGDTELKWDDIDEATKEKLKDLKINSETDYNNMMDALKQDTIDGMGRVDTETKNALATLGITADNGWGNLKLITDKDLSEVDALALGYMKFSDLPQAIQDALMKDHPGSVYENLDDAWVAINNNMALQGGRFTEIVDRQKQALQAAQEQAKKLKEVYNSSESIVARHQANMTNLTGSVVDIFKSDKEGYAKRTLSNGKVQYSAAASNAWNEKTGSWEQTATNSKYGHEDFWHDVSGDISITGSRIAINENKMSKDGEPVVYYIYNLDIVDGDERKKGQLVKRYDTGDWEKWIGNIKYGAADVPQFKLGGMITGDGLFRAGEFGLNEAIVPLEQPQAMRHIGAALAAAIPTWEMVAPLANALGQRDGGVAQFSSYHKEEAANNVEEIVSRVLEAQAHRAPQPSYMGGDSDTRRPLYVGTLIADNAGLRELDRRMKRINRQDGGM